MCEELCALCKSSVKQKIFYRNVLLKKLMLWRGIFVEASLPAGGARTPC